MKETVIETKNCKQCNSLFNITDKDLKFYKKISPKFNGEIFQIPTPNSCPDCRQQRRFAWRNERNLYKRKCDLTGKKIISIYSSDKPYKIYDQSEWWSDKWDPMYYGKDYNFSTLFFEQFEDIMLETPKSGLNGFGNINCEYTNFLGNSSNCYFTIAGVDNQNVLYSYWMDSCTNCVDCSLCKKSENLYSCIDCINCFNCNFCQNCIDCNNCYFSQDLIGKSNYWCNKQYSKEEIQIFLTKYNSSNNKKIVQSSTKMINSQDCTGNNLLNCFNCNVCFDIEDSEECNFGSFGFNMVSSNDFDYDSGSELIYQSHTGYKNKLSGFLLYGNEITHSYYILDCFNSSNLFGCTGLRNKQYCILNKQYTKDEYNIIVPQIIEHMQKTGEWGDFFPSSISPFGYNETVAQDYYPLTKDEVLAKGFNWSDYKQPFPKVEKIIPAHKLPNNIKDIPDDILNWAIKCEISEKPFRIIKEELEFYRKHNLPIPRRHHDIRHLDRLKNKNITK